MVINLFTGPSLPPSNLYINAVDFDSNLLAFTWSPVSLGGSALHYNILSLNCGSCPTTTTNTTVTCTDVPTDGSVCTFAVQTVVCENVVSDKSDSVNVTTLDSNQTENVKPKG